jgi:iron complex outermembrane receptor protein
MATNQTYRFGKAFALAGISAVAVMSSGAAFAQQAATNAPEEIIVTAQRRAERLQDVPVAITAATPQTLERQGVTGIRDLGSMVPGMKMAGAGANVSPSIRGIHSDQTDPGNDPNVSLYIDGVYMPDQLLNSMDLGDISRVEVLKGPQGTLFGRNATGGAIRIFTREPDLNAFTGSLNLSYGRYNEVNADAFVSAPVVTDRLAVSVSGHYHREDGYMHDVVRNKTFDGEDKVVRLKILAQPTDNFKAEAFATYVHHSDPDASAYSSYDGVSSLGNGIPGVVVPTAHYTFAAEEVPQLKANDYMAGLRLTLDTDFGELTSLSAYNGVKSGYTTDADFSSADLVDYPIIKKQGNFQQELTFASKKFGDFQLTAGGNYYGDTARYNPLVFEGLAIAAPPALGGFGVPIAAAYMKQRTDAYGVFGELTYTPTDRITLLAGVRYSNETRDASGCYCTFFAAPPAVYATPATLPPIGKVTYGSVTPRASVRYRLTDDDDNVYFTFSQGFKSGGFNLSALQTTPFKPEKLTSYEIGLKTSPSRMFSANIAAFYYDYKNEQTMTVFGLVNITSNAGASRVYGADADFVARLTNEFTVTGGVSVLDDKYTNYPLPAVLIPGTPFGRATASPDPTSPLYSPYAVNLKGQRPANAPTFTATITADYKTELSAGVVDLNATMYYTSKFDFFPYPGPFQPAYATLAARASFAPANSNFEFYVYGKNLTNHYYILNMFDGALGTGARPARPATYGAGFKYDF